MTKPVIEIQNVTFGYRKDAVLDGINLSIQKDAYLAIIGPNGGGKTTLLKLILGLLKPWSGKILYHFSSIDRKGLIGYIPQFVNFDKNFPLKVQDVVLMGKLGERGLLTKYSKADRIDANAALDKVNLTKYKKIYINELSGGQLQRVIIARAIASNPDIILLDEPTSSIDMESKSLLGDLLLELNCSIPIVIVTHDMMAISPDVKQIACVNRYLYYHEDGKLTQDIIDETYACPVDIISHGLAHRVLRKHGKAHGHGCLHDLKNSTKKGAL